MPETGCHERIAESLAELHKGLKRMQSRMLKEYGISLIEYHILAVVRRSDSASQSELAEALDVDKALISRQIQSLQEKKLLGCRLDPDCRRRNILSLSESALQLLPQLEDIHKRSLDRLFEDCDEKKLTEMQYFLEGLVSKI